MTELFAHTEQSTERLKERQDELHDQLSFTVDQHRLSNLRHELACVAMELRVRTGEKVDEKS